MRRLVNRWLVCLFTASGLFTASSLLTASGLVAAFVPLPVAAHGERATEPYIRTRTVHWYDVTWSSGSIAANDEITVAGKFRLFSDWPDAASLPDLVFLSNGSPGAVLTRVESYISGIPARQSARGLKTGKDYTFKLVMKGRVPGKWHLHPVLNVHGAGAIVGPGAWVEVTGKQSDYKEPLTTMTGVKIDDLQTYGVARAQMWHFGYGVLALLWLLWWLRRPLIIPRWLVTQKGREDLLITSTDDKVAAALLVTVLLVVIIGYKQTVEEFPNVVPLQAGFVKVPVPPNVPEAASIEVKNAEYDVPGRSLRMDVVITNNTDRPIRVGEFMTAQLRFINKDLPAAVESIDPSFPKDLLAGAGLKVGSDSPIAPGESRSTTLDATDAAWEVERLVSFLSNVDSRVGGLVFFYNDQGERHMSEISGAVVPVFTQLGSKVSRKAPEILNARVD